MPCSDDPKRRMLRRPPCPAVVLLTVLAVLSGAAVSGCSDNPTTNSHPNNDGGANGDGAGGARCRPTGEEVCDGADNNCDGQVDEGVSNACGMCSGSCFDVTAAGALGDGAIILSAGDPSNPAKRAGVSLNARNRAYKYLWVPNHTVDSISKFNSETEQEEARYWVGVNPSRTAVDLDGNAWVGGRGTLDEATDRWVNGGQLTKIIADPGACPDRNGNGQIETSRLVEGQIVQVNSAADPFADECVVYSAIPNPAQPSIRGLAVGPDGLVWIGYTASGVQPIHPIGFAIGPFYGDDAVPLWTTGEDSILRAAGSTVSLGGVYGLVSDAQGVLYVAPTGERTYLAAFDTVKRAWVAAYQRASKACSYGIAVDRLGRVWTGTGTGECAGVGMFDPHARRLYTFAVPAETTPQLGGTVPVQLIDRAGPGGDQRYLTTGVAVEPATGDIWASFYKLGYSGRLRVDDTDLAKSQWTLIGTHKATAETNLAVLATSESPTDLRGIGFDGRGFAWTLGLATDRLFKLDPATNARAASLPEGKPVGLGTHYTYSDFSGSSVFNFTAPQGSWRHFFEPAGTCFVPEKVVWEAFVPESTAVKLRIRVAGGETMGEWIPAAERDGEVYFSYPTGETRATIDLKPYAERLNGERYEIEVVLTSSTGVARPVLHLLGISVPLSCLI